MYNEPKLYDVLSASYGNLNSQNTLDKFGYKQDADLSNHNEQVYFNKDQNKLLYSITGTHNLQDIGTDAYLAVGKIKDTKRYQEADETLQHAKTKYGVSNATVVGASLGGTIGGYISSRNDRVLTHNKGATIGQPVRSNEIHYRNSGDIVSIMNANSTNTKNLKNNNKITGHLLYDAYKSHSIENLKHQPIFV